jgi:hypothetical protein
MPDDDRTFLRTALESVAGARIEYAARELQATISARYPAATFRLVRAADDPLAYHLLAAVDVDDPDDVGDLVLDRMLGMQIDEGIPLHVIPLTGSGRWRS